jgi:predicted dienelactone hydrolase
MRRRGALAALLCAAVARPAPAAGPVCEAAWHDAARDRDVPVRIRMPDGVGRAPVILFSHGLAGSLDGGTVWGKAWADAGFVVIHLQHPGSDGGILRGARGRLGEALKAAMSGEQLRARVGDVGFVFDRLKAGGQEGACALGRIDLTHVGMSGHSFGAHTAQALAGQRFPAMGAMGADPRITAFVALSPSPPQAGSDTMAMAGIVRPFFSITGTADTTRVLPGITAADRERPFRAMPPGGKYLLVLNNATHADFGGNPGGMRRSVPSARVARVVIDATTAFWRWTLLGDPRAKAALDGPGGIQTELAPGDRLERK